MSSSLPPLKIREVDGSPSKRPVFELIFPNGTVSISGTSATIDVSGASSSYFLDTLTNNSGADLLNGRAVRLMIQKQMLL
jgi:hypothetical protein